MILINPCPKKSKFVNCDPSTMIDKDSLYLVHEEHRGKTFKPHKGKRLVASGKKKTKLAP